MTGDGIHFVETDEARRAVERPRYDAYVVGMKRERPTADHEARLRPLLRVKHPEDLEEYSACASPSPPPTTYGQTTVRVPPFFVTQEVISDN